MLEYAALVVSPRALPDGLILVFQNPVKVQETTLWEADPEFVPNLLSFFQKDIVCQSHF